MTGEEEYDDVASFDGSWMLNSFERVLVLQVQRDLDVLLSKPTAPDPSPDPLRRSQAFEALMQPSV
jgi:hypothetical protein